MPKVIVSLELDRDLHRRVKAQARRAKRSVSALVDLWLAEWVAERRREELEQDGRANCER